MSMSRAWWAAAALMLAVVWAKAGAQDFTLINKTGVEIHAVFLSPSDQNEWGNDILGEDTLADGEKATITVNAEADVALWDLKVTDPDGNAIVWHKLNLLKISALTLHYNAKSGEATATAK